MQIDSSELLAREQLAGYEPELLARAVVVLVGAGAAGNNIAQHLALVGVGEVRIVDFDVVETSNLTRSPLFRRAPQDGGARRKAKELALALREISHAPDPIARYATSSIESLGLGAFEGAAVVISAVDSFEVRAYLAGVTRLLGIPMVEVGFGWPHGSVSVFVNNDANGPCWRCLHPSAGRGRFSCQIYATGMAATGRIAATQSIAAMTSAVAAEATVQAIHGRYPLGDSVVHMNVLRGGWRHVSVAVDPECPGTHRRLGEIRRLPVRASEPMQVALDGIAVVVPDAVVHLPAPYVVEAPCARCGAAVALGKPDWSISAPPLCRTCPTIAQLTGSAPVLVHEVRSGDEIAKRSCRSFGLPPAAIFEVSSPAARGLVAFQLEGTVEDLFITKMRIARNGGAKARTSPSEQVLHQQGEIE